MSLQDYFIQITTPNMDDRESIINHLRSVSAEPKTGGVKWLVWPCICHHGLTMRQSVHTNNPHRLSMYVNIQVK